MGLTRPSYTAYPGSGCGQVATWARPVPGQVKVKSLSAAVGLRQKPYAGLGQVGLGYRVS
jgi:hypothetical protein